MVQIETLSDRCLSDVIRLYNRSVESNIHSGRLDEALWTSLIAAKPYYSADDVLVAHDADAALGYVHLCHGPNADYSAPDPASGTIEMLCFEPQRPDVGRALVAAAVQRHRTGGARQILACSTFAGYPLYRGIFVGLEPMIVARDQHVVQVLLAEGFQEHQHSVLMGITYDRPVAEPAPAVDLNFSVASWHPEPAWAAATWRGLEPYRCVAIRAGQTVGHCLYAIMPVISARSSAIVGSIAELVTHPAWRRKGIGALLTAKALNHMRGLGATRATLGTQHDNWAAHATYRRNGFAIEEHLFAFVLDLSSPALAG